MTCMLIRGTSCRKVGFLGYEPQDRFWRSRELPKSSLQASKTLPRGLLEASKRLQDQLHASQDVRYTWLGSLLVWLHLFFFATLFCSHDFHAKLSSMPFSTLMKEGNARVGILQGCCWELLGLLLGAHEWLLGAPATTLRLARMKINFMINFTVIFGLAHVK